MDLRDLSSKNSDLKTMVVAFEILQKSVRPILAAAAPSAPPARPRLTDAPSRDACRYYTERMGALWLAEPLTLFWALWKVLSPLVAPDTREKIRFLRGKEARCAPRSSPCAQIGWLPAQAGSVGATLAGGAGGSGALRRLHRARRVRWHGEAAASQCGACALGGAHQGAAVEVLTSITTRPAKSCMRLFFV